MKAKEHGPRPMDWMYGADGGPERKPFVEHRRTFEAQTTYLCIFKFQRL
jgi:hypothetical protein